LRACLLRPTDRSRLSLSTTDQLMGQDVRRMGWRKHIRKFAPSTVTTGARARRARQDVSQLGANSSNISTAMMSYFRENSTSRFAVCEIVLIAPPRMERRGSTL